MAATEKRRGRSRGSLSGRGWGRGARPVAVAGVVLLALVFAASPGCGRKAKPQPLWGKAAFSQAPIQTR